MNVLILGLGGNVAQGILKALRASRLNCRVLGACVSSSAAGLYMCDAAHISPYANDPAFIPWLIELCRKEQVDAVMSGVEEVLEVIAAQRELLEKTLNTRFIVSGVQELSIGRDKLETCRWLQRTNCAYPLFAASDDAAGLQQLAEQTGYRLIAKPRWGKGSHGLMRLRTKDDLKRIATLRDYVVQEEIGSAADEYTVGCYINKSGKLVASIIMHRELLHGATSKATVAFNPKIEQEVALICSAFKARGPLNIQMRLTPAGEAVCFELNVRFSGTSPMRAYFGFNDVEAALREYVLGEDISGLFSVRPGTALRYWDEIYIETNTVKQLEQQGRLTQLSECGRLGQK